MLNAVRGAWAKYRVNRGQELVIGGSIGKERTLVVTFLRTACQPSTPIRPKLVEKKVV